MDIRPVIAVTAGDPAGIGPEIVACAFSNPVLHRQARLVAIGPASVMRRAIDLTGLRLGLRQIQHPAQAAFDPDTLDLIDPTDLDLADLQPGRVQPSGGLAASRSVERAARLAMAGEVDAMATSPINKEAFRAAGVPFVDHTEMLAKLASSPDLMTLFVVGKLRIFFLTRHISLSEACKQVTRDNIVRALERAQRSLAQLGIERPRIAVAGLNPHAGEGGLFGSEETEQIAPAIALARDRGIDAIGPLPPDSVFFLAARSEYDAVLALYHDQGHIAAKTLDFEHTVSITLGLPFLRTSVDHGTAYDIAWKGVASSTSMEEAIRVAAECAPLFRPE